MKKFKNNLMSLLKLFDTDEEIIDFLINKKAFNEEFVKKIIEGKNEYLLIKNGMTIEDIKNSLKYDVSFKNDKFSVDITKNDVFSYLDTETELRKKMKNYIKTEQYEKADILKNYFNTIELEF